MAESEKPKHDKPCGWDFYHKTLGAPKYVVAPMVEASELAWRLLCRRHSAQLCYTPMWHSTCFVKDPKYRKDALQSCPEDRPLIVQFCGNDPEILLQAGQLAEDSCDAIDINLGCPQTIAKRGHYGAFLQDEWKLLEKIVRTLHLNLKVPITCKIRVFESLERTISYAQMLQKAGAQILTVHGRTREQKGPNTGVADWSYIKKVRESVKIPVFANGNIMSLEDVHRCIEETGVTGVMSAEGNLTNPAIFDGINPTSWDMAKEYLALVEQYPVGNCYVRGHMFKIFNSLLTLKENAKERERMGMCHGIEEFREITEQLEKRWRPYHEGEKVWIPEVVTYNLRLPPWLCQPYIRPPPEEHKRKLEEAQRIAEDPNTTKKCFYDSHGNQISRKKMKRMQKIMRRPGFDPSIERGDRKYESCSKEDCGNPVGTRCEYEYCRNCCKLKCFKENLNCNGHKILIKLKREKALKLAESEAALRLEEKMKV